MKRRIFLSSGLIAASCFIGVGAPPATAQDKYPSRPIRLVVPFAPGGNTDLFGRKFAERASRHLGQTMIVDNRGGASGIIGSVEVAKARPDGYTALFGTASTHAVNPTAMAKPAYDAINDFIPIAVVGLSPLTIAVNPDVPVHSLKDMIALAKASPGKYSYSTAGTGTINYLAFEWFKAKEGLDVLHIPYKGSNPALQDVLAGHVPFYLDTFAPILALHKAGKLRIIAVANDRRSSVAPEIPTGAEAGVPGLVFYTFNAVFVPAGTPQAVVDTLHAATMKVMADESLKADLASLAIDPITDSNPEKARQLIRTEIARWAPLIKQAGVKIE